MILMAEDDSDDRLLFQDAFREAGLSGELKFVYDGVELMDYLHHQGNYQKVSLAPRPDLVLLDLKMPRKNGWEALQELRSDPQLRDLPVFILTTSTDEEDRQRARHLGADGYYTKQSTFQQLIDVIHQIVQAWERKRIEKRE